MVFRRQQLAAKCGVRSRVFRYSRGRKLYGRLPSFTAWLERLIETQDEVIRTLYDEDVLYDELNLG